MLIVRPEVSFTEKSAEEMIHTFVGAGEARVTSVTVWGKRPLAYPINKLTEGFYVVATLTSPALRSSDLEARAASDTNIVRFLLTLKA